MPAGGPAPPDRVRSMPARRAGQGDAAVHRAGVQKLEAEPLRPGARAALLLPGPAGPSMVIIMACRAAPQRERGTFAPSPGRTPPVGERSRFHGTSTMAWGRGSMLRVYMPPAGRIAWSCRAG